MTNWQEPCQVISLSHVTPWPSLDKRIVKSHKHEMLNTVASLFRINTKPSPYCYFLFVQATAPWPRRPSRRPCPRCCTRGPRWCPHPPPPRPPRSPRCPPSPPSTQWPRCPAWWRRPGPARLPTRSIAPRTKLTSSPPSRSRQSSATSKPTVSEIIDDLCRKKTLREAFCCNNVNLCFERAGKGNH